jgi:hypothetical protein
LKEGQEKREFIDQHVLMLTVDSSSRNVCSMPSGDVRNVKTAFNGDAVFWVGEGVRSSDLGNFVEKGHEEDG